MLTIEEERKFGAGALLCYVWGPHAACSSYKLS